MVAGDKIEAVKKVTEALQKQQNPQVDTLEHELANKEHFQNLLNTPTHQPPSFQVVDSSSANPEGINHIENNPILSEEKTQIQKNGSATDQERKRRQHQEDDEEIASIEGVSKKKATPSSLMEEVSKLGSQVSKTSALSPEELKNQAKAVIAQIDDVKTQLSQSKGQLKPSYQTLLHNRLTHIDDTLKIALSKAGVEYTPPEKTALQAKSRNPIERFLGFLTNSQYQLEHLSQTIENLGMTNVEMTPAKMLTIQMKMGYVQQQVELFTSLLNKALESTKTIMNVQV